MADHRALSLALAASVVIHALAIGVGELVGPGADPPAPRPDPVVEYRTDPGERKAPGEEKAEEQGAGKSVSLDTPDPVYRPYFSDLTRAIDARWGKAELVEGDPKAGRVSVEFTLSADGELLAVSVARSSGVRGMDLAAVKAVKGAAPFNPIPAEIATRELTVTALFVYD